MIVKLPSSVTGRQFSCINQLFSNVQRKIHEEKNVRIKKKENFSEIDDECVKQGIIINVEFPIIHFFLLILLLLGL